MPDRDTWLFLVCCARIRMAIGNWEWPFRRTFWTIFGLLLRQSCDQVDGVLPAPTVLGKLECVCQVLDGSDFWVIQCYSKWQTHVGMAANFTWLLNKHVPGGCGRVFFTRLETANHFFTSPPLGWHYINASKNAGKSGICFANSPTSAWACLGRMGGVSSNSNPGITALRLKMVWKKGTCQRSVWEICQWPKLHEYQN